MRPLYGALVAFAATVALRIPFATSHLYAWDSTLYARALEHGFRVTADITTESPHPPGYILYVAAAAAIRLITRDSNTALVTVSIVASALCAAAFYLIARTVVRPRTAAVATGALIASPVVWMYSEVAYPYTALALLSLTLGWWMLRGDRPLLMSAAFGVLAGFRQDLLVLLAPLWLWRVERLARRDALIAAAAVAAGCLVWAIPTVALSGGVVPYLSALATQSGRATGGMREGGADAFSVNVVLTGEGLVWGVLPFALILIADALWAVARPRAWRLRREAVPWLLWIGTPLLFYVFVHIGEWGYTLSVIPPILLAAAIRSDRAIPRIPAVAWTAFAALAIVLPAVMFLASDGRFTAERLRQRDLELGSARVGIERALPRAPRPPGR